MERGVKEDSFSIFPMIPSSFFSLCCIGITLFSLPLSVASAATTPPTLLIGEVLWSGSSLSTADEWLEIWNVSTTSVPLAGYTLMGASGSSALTFPSRILAPGETFLIANYDQVDAKSHLAVTPQLITTAVSIPNDAMQLQLIAPDQTVIDSIAETKPPAGSSGTPKISMIRDLSSSTIPWIAQTQSRNLKTTVTDLATPGFCDGCAEYLAALLLPTPSPIMESTSTAVATTTIQDESKAIEVKTEYTTTIVTTTERIATTIEGVVTTTTEIIAYTATTTISSSSTDTVDSFHVWLSEIFPAPMVVFVV
jgi:hypothetical protein